MIVDLILIVKSDIIIIETNTDKKIIVYKENLEILTQFWPALWSKTYKFEHIAQRNHIKPHIMFEE